MKIIFIVPLRPERDFERQENLDCLRDGASAILQDLTHTAAGHIGNTPGRLIRLSAVERACLQAFRTGVHAVIVHAYRIEKGVEFEPAFRFPVGQ